jgi:hypothetical protein
MAVIRNVALAITPDRLNDRAGVVVNCEISFSDFEVNAMNALGLRYTLGCDLVDKDVLYDKSVVDFPKQVLPRGPLATREERAQFQTVAAMHDLHYSVFSKDVLVAQVRLTNGETGAEVEARSRALTVDLST